MRSRHALATAALGTALALGALAAPAQAAQQGVASTSFTSARAATSASGDERQVSGPAGWVYANWFLFQSTCRAEGSNWGIEWRDWYCEKSGALWYLYFWRG
ncbi:hypothetical protein GCM10010240_56370 [Streptomyces griseoviridis]|nr:hypothetical protein GCM10010240_56370 [Streptomyces griseoviridis]